ncbi:glycine--tRNA ligase [Sugiyamaella lignohabitans]|uniref:glycine--tRNA ligase n=1 Tax=Sugiyamaella lignohabitans TaxID=796027 RepID=A0A167FI28_9ASCO|nr:glycine--tRNA ligase [Sugiyamaella lignohabitans]ANB15325.1 glycine--tRNA ligase [Sugiyamaella lignohabitans]
MSESTITSRPPVQDREVLESLLKHRFFYGPSFEIYGGVSGLYDYGPAGCALQANIIDTWRKHFVLEEDMLEVDCPALTPYDVLKTSGHVDKFADWVSRDLATGEIFRADHLVEEVLESRLKGDKEARGVVESTDPAKEEKDKKRKKKVKETKAIKLDDETVAEYESILAQIDGYSGPQLGELMVKHKIVNPTTGGELEAPREFNLMFETAIGPSGQLKGYLRPETAQGQFLNFSKLLESNNSKMPFASASIGKSFRNEISPRAGLLRVREFLMAEVEHFVDPNDKSHARFDEIKDIRLRLWPMDVQAQGKTDISELSIGEAVSTGMIDNQTLGYFLARIYLFMIKIGIDPKRMRFRQHMANEMAHYAADCWDCELQSSYGWIECVGCADRSAYDLTVHSARTKEKLVVRQTLDEPVTVESFEVELQKKKFGPKFRKDAPKVEEFLLSRTECERENLAQELKDTGKIVFEVAGIDGKIELDSSFITIEKRTRVEHIREYTPNVIEPSFGIGRILYSLIEHSFWTRPEDAQRGVLSFPPTVSPTKVLVVPLSSNAEFTPIARELVSKLRRLGIQSKVDDSSASIGKRYARNDELGTPFGITIDFQTVKDGSLTIRERDSTKQVRGSQDEVLEALRSLIFDGVSWESGTSHLATFVSQDIE